LCPLFVMLAKVPSSSDMPGRCLPPLLLGTQQLEREELHASRHLAARQAAIHGGRSRRRCYHVPLGARHQSGRCALRHTAASRRHEAEVGAVPEGGWRVPGGRRARPGSAPPPRWDPSPGSPRSRTHANRLQRRPTWCRRFRQTGPHAPTAAQRTRRPGAGGRRRGVVPARHRAHGHRQPPARDHRCLTQPARGGLVGRAQRGAPGWCCSGPSSVRRSSQISL